MEGLFYAQDRLWQIFSQSQGRRIYVLPGQLKQKLLQVLGYLAGKCGGAGCKED